MTLREAIDEAIAMGYEGAEEITLSSGETVYLLMAGDGAIIGLPTYIHEVDGIVVASTYEESMALFDEPNYLKE